MKNPRLVVLATTLLSTSIWEASAWAQAPEPAPSAAAPAPEPVVSPAAAPPPPVVSPATAPPPPVVVAQPRPTPTVLEISTLAELRDRGTITQAEYDAAMKDLAGSTGEKVAGDSPSLVVGKWSTTLYGFAETDFIYDTTESFSDLAGNVPVQRAVLTPPMQGVGLNTYAGNHGRTTFSVRNSRLGLRLRAPEVSGIRTSAMVEMDFLGSVPAPNPSSTSSNTYSSGSASEATYFASPSLRIRHAMLRMETPVVDLLVGQYWDLFGWTEEYQPNSVQIQGLPGKLYARSPQLRISKSIKSEFVNVDIAVAAVRPPARDSQAPDGEGGIRIALPFWKGVSTSGATATSVLPFSVAVTGDYRHFSVPEMNVSPVNSISLDTFAGAVDVLIPVIPAKHVEDGNALTITGEAVTGSGMADLYQSLTGGVTFPVLANTLAVNPAPVYPQNVDNGLVDFCPIATGMPAACPGNPGSLVGVKWESFTIGAQYYLPGVKGRLWISGNFSYMKSPNSADFTRPSPATNPVANYYGSTVAQVLQSSYFVDGNLFFQIVPAARIGAEYAVFNDQYVDQIRAVNQRFELGGWFIF